MKFSRLIAQSQRGRSRRSGQVVVYAALTMPVLLGATALSVDLGRLYFRQAQAQRAADAAALGGAWCDAFVAKCSADTNNSDALRAAYYAKANGFDPASSTVTMTTTPNWKGQPTQYHVDIASKEPLFFAYIFGIRSSVVHASATALYSAYEAVPISGSQFGLGQSAVYNYSMFGPYAFYSYGDYTATKYFDSTQGALNDGKPNPQYSPNGLNFFVNVPDSKTYVNNQKALKKALAKLATPIVPKTAPTSLIDFQIYDPSTTDNGLDEIRAPNKTDAGYGGSQYTTTKYSLVFDKNGSVPAPNDAPDPTNHVVVASASYGNDTSVAKQWVTPSGFEIDLSQPPYSQYPNGTFHINAVATDGSSENGFSIRAGPPDSSLSGSNSSTANDQLWQQEYGQGPTDANGNPIVANGSGVSAGAQNILPVNFNVNGTADIELGTISATNPAPANATNAGTITVSKYDTDVGAQSITYYMANTDGTTTNFDSSYVFQNSSVKLNNNNGVFSTDTIVLPTSFKSGTLHVKYTAGAADTSEWSMQYSEAANSQGSIKLVE